MAAFLRRLFRIYAGEGAKVLSFGALAALLQAGVALGLSAADTLFLTGVGAEQLPVVYIFLPVVMLFVTPGLSYLGRRLGQDRLLGIVLVTLVAGGMLIFLLLGLATGQAALAGLAYAVKFYASLWLIYLYTLFWNYADGYFDIVDAKRLFAFFSGGMSLGAVVGGLLVTLLVGRLQVEQLFLVWSVTALAALPLLLHIRRRYALVEVEEEDGETGFADFTRRVLSACRHSRYVLAIMLLAVIMVMLYTTCEFQYLTVFSDFEQRSPTFSTMADGALLSVLAKPTNKEELAALFGTLFAGVNVINLVITLFLFNRLVAVLGVRNTALIQPGVYLGTFAVMRLHPGYEAALLGFVAYQGLHTAIDFNNANFVINAAPGDVKREIRAFIEGLLEPAAGSLAGLMLLLATAGWATSVIPSIGLGLALAALVVVLVLRRHYVLAMLGNLKRGWLDFSRPDEELLVGLDEAETAALAQVVREGDAASAYTALRLLLLNDRRRCLDLVLGYMARDDAAAAQRVASLLATMLEDEEDEVVRRLLSWLETAGHVPGATLIEELGAHSLARPQAVVPLLASSDPDDRSAAAVALWNSWDLTCGLQAMDVARQLLRGSTENVVAGIRVLGRMGQERFAQLLVPYLTHSSPQIRRGALRSIHRLVDRGSSRLLPDILAAVERGDPEERALGLETLAGIGDSRCVVPLLSISASFTHFERRKAAQVILALGQRSVPAIVAVLRDPEYSYVSRSIASRCLGTLLFPQFEAMYPAIIRVEIERAYRFIYCHSVLEQAAAGAATAGVGVLSRFYRESAGRIVEFVLEILAIGGRLPDYELIGFSLNAPNPKTRGNAIETIEQACPRRVFRLLLPLLDRRSVADKLRLYRQLGGATLSIQEVLARGLDSSFGLESAAAAQALYEAQQRAALTALRRRLRRAPAPLLGSVVGSLFIRAAHGDGPAPLNTIERVDRLARTRFFAAFGAEELRVIAAAATEADHPSGATLHARGTAADRLYLVLDGQVQLQEQGGTTTRGPGQTYGESCLLGQRQWDATAVSRGARLLTVPKQPVLAAAEVYPKIALGLLRQKCRADGAPGTAPEQW